MNTITVVTANGNKEYVYDENTKFLVQVGKGSKGSYSTKCCVTNFRQAKMHFDCINIGYGYKKRLVMLDADSRKVLARQFS